MLPATPPFILGGALRRPRWRESQRSIGAIAVVLAVVLAPVRGLYRATGSSMEEGFMLVFPKLVQQGRAPNEDFLHLYGPASLDVLALWYRVAGDTLESQRTFGLLQHLGVVFAVYAIVRAWGHLAAVGAALVTTMLIVTPIGLSALAWHGALALGLWSIVFGVRSLATGSARDLWWAGGFAGLALGYRPDLVVALTLATGFVLWQRKWQGWQFLATGAVIGLLPMWYHLARVGIGPAFRGMVLEPIVDLRPGRELPRPPGWDVADGALQAVAEGIPPWWGLPALGHSQQLFFWFFAVIIVAFAVPAVAFVVRRRSTGDRAALATVLLAAGLFGLGILPQALQRPDSTHLAWVAVVSWSLAVPAIVLVIGDRLGRPSIRPAVAATVAVGVLMLVVCPFYTYRHYLLHTRVSAGQLPVPFLVERDDHRFWFGDFFVAKALNEMIPDLDARSEPGDRLIVGPADLSRTIYSDVSVYFLFPELEPATYYIEMDPGLADTEGSGLADDIETADFLVLTNIWTGWNEPNASDLHLSQEHNRAVADNFCLVGQYEGNLVLLFERCDGGGGVDPSTVPGPFPVVANDDD